MKVDTCKDEGSGFRFALRVGTTSGVEVRQFVPERALRDRSSEVREGARAAVTAARRLEPLSADRFGVHFTADAEFKALLERVRGLASHRLPGGDLLTLMRRGLEAYARELEKERFGIGRKRARPSPARSEIELPIRRAQARARLPTR